MAFDRALGDEQPRADLLVAQAVRYQPRDLGLALPEHAGVPRVSGRGGRGTASRSASRSRLLSKLGLRDRVHAVILAYEAGIRVPGDS